MRRPSQSYDQKPTASPPVSRIHPSYMDLAAASGNDSAPYAGPSASTQRYPNFQPQPPLQQPLQQTQAMSAQPGASMRYPGSPSRNLTTYGQPPPMPLHPLAHSNPQTPSAASLDGMDVGGSSNVSHRGFGNDDDGDDDDDDEDEADDKQASMGSAKKRGRNGAGSGSSKAGQAGNSSSSKRQRVHFSCTECHRRKQKCNRQTPCQHCIARKVPELCKTFTPGQEEGWDLTARVNKLERTVEDGFDKIMEMLQRQQRAVSAAAAASASSSSAAPAPANAATGGKNSASSARPTGQAKSESSTHHAKGPTVPADGSEAGDEANEGGTLNFLGTFHGSGSTNAMRIESLLDNVGSANAQQDGSEGDAVPRPGEITMPLSQVAGNSARGMDDDEDLDVKMGEFGATERISKAFAASIPSRAICHELVGHFWQHLNWLRHPVPEKLLRPQIEHFLESCPGETTPTRLTTANVNVFACMMLIMAISALSVESDQFPKDGQVRRRAARAFEWTGRRSLVLSSVLLKDDVLQVLGFNLAWRFLTLDRRLSEAWRCSCHSITAAYAIGLHRDGSKLGLPQLETDLRRGVWSMVQFSDLVLAMTLGRPPVSDLDRVFTDTELPTLRGLKHWWPAPPDELENHPKAKAGEPSPSIYMHTLNRTDTAKVTSRIVEVYQKLEPHHYSDITSIDAEILEIREKLPYYYQVAVTQDGNVEYDRSLDEEYSTLPVHRFLIHTQLFFLRISLHRSYLLRSGAKGSSGQRFAPSRRACIESAMDDLAVRTEFVRYLQQKYGVDGIPLYYYIHIGTYAWFNSLLIASVAALLDPDMPELPKLREQLQRFFHSNEIKKQGLYKAHNEVRDEVRDREATILAMFLKAIDRAQAARAEAKQKQGNTKERKESSPTAKGGRSKPRDARRSPGPAASREEATADVLLDLGKTGASAGGTDASKKADDSNSSGPANPPSGGPKGKGRTQSDGHASSMSPLPGGPRNDRGSQTHLRKDSSSSQGMQSVNGHPAAATVASPYGANNSSIASTPTATGPPQRTSQLVDSAQADFNAWFQKEFAGGSFLADNSFADLAMTNGAGARGGDNGMSGSAANPLSSLFGAGGAGWAAQGAGGGGDKSGPYNSASTSNNAGPGYNFSNMVGPQQQANQQWSRLPQPGWEQRAGVSPHQIERGASGPELRGHDRSGSMQSQYQQQQQQSNAAPGSRMDDKGHDAYNFFGNNAPPTQVPGAGAQNQQHGRGQGNEPNNNFNPNNMDSGNNGEAKQGPLYPMSSSAGGYGDASANSMMASMQGGPFGDGAGGLTDQQQQYIQQQQQQQQGQSQLGGQAPAQGAASGAAALNAAGGAGESFDPGFWADLISKIST
ncbi:unnamed protein product [Jaminaea pallidilutea]